MKIKPSFLKNLSMESGKIAEGLKILPNGNRLIVPFVGDASIFLNTNYKNYILADQNPDLINLYKMLAAYQEAFIEKCKMHFCEAYNNIDVYNYYLNIFNEIKTQVLNTSRKLMQACLFVYLINFGERETISYNKKGNLNIKYGKPKKIYFPKREMMLFVDKINSTDLVIFQVGDFRDILFETIEQDVVFCAPCANNNWVLKKEFYYQDLVELKTICDTLLTMRNISSIVMYNNQLEYRSTAINDGQQLIQKRFYS